MGNFYVNYTVRGASQEEVAVALAGRGFFSTKAGCETCFFAQNLGLEVDYT